MAPCFWRATSLIWTILLQCSCSITIKLALNSASNSFSNKILLVLRPSSIVCKRQLRISHFQRIIREPRTVLKMAKGAEKQRKKKPKSENTIGMPMKKALGTLNPTSSEQFEDLLRYHAKEKAHRRIAELWGQASTAGLLTGELGAQLILAELKLQKPLQATKLAQKRHSDLARGVNGYFPMNYAAGIIKTMARNGEIDTALELTKEMNIFQISEQTDLNFEEAGVLKAQVFGALGLGLGKSGDTARASHMIQRLSRHDVNITQDALNLLLAQLGKARALPNIFDVLDVFAARGIKPNDETFEFLANAAVRSVEFVTGAVSMDTLPKQDRLEVVFIGRSNVGKSSLINMICNRKSLAFTSKTPGKTQQFNYFVVNNGTENSFYLVDVPGLGYAEVSKHQVVQWREFLSEYLKQRLTLRVVFHLIDSRHGPVEVDKEIMAMMRGAPDHLTYVIVLTKADKNDGKISRAINDKLQEELKQIMLNEIPVIATSSESRLGRDSIWRFLKQAAISSNASLPCLK